MKSEHAAFTVSSQPCRSFYYKNVKIQSILFNQLKRKSVSRSLIKCSFSVGLVSSETAIWIINKAEKILCQQVFEKPRCYQYNRSKVIWGQQIKLYVFIASKAASCLLKTINYLFLKHLIVGNIQLFRRYLIIYSIIICFL